MSRLRPICLLPAAVLSLCLASASVTPAEVPAQMAYQVMLTDDSDQPLSDQPVELVFRIYNAEETLLWTETHSATTNSIGVVSVFLGETVTLPAGEFGVPLWLDVTVDGEPLLPRRQLVCAPYAFHGYDTDRLGGEPAEGFVRDTDIEGFVSEEDLNGFVQDAELSTPGTLNLETNPVDWTKLKGVPEGFADSVDDEGGSFGDGHSLDAADGDPSDVVCVDEEGLVGIGVTEPEEQLHVRGTLAIQGGGTDDYWSIQHLAYQGIPEDYGLQLKRTGDSRSWTWGGSLGWNAVSSRFSVNLWDGADLGLMANSPSDTSCIRFYTQELYAQTPLAKIWSQGGSSAVPALYLAAGAGAKPQVTLSEAGSVGIGTSEPQEMLDVRGNLVVADIKSHENDLNITSAQGGWGITIAGDHVGIGTDAPEAPLDVRGTLLVSKIFAHDLSTLEITDELGAGIVINDGDVGVRTASPEAELDVVGDIKVNDIRSHQNQFDFYDASGGHMTLNQGKLGVGTGSPATALDVRGNITVRAESDGDIVIELGEGLDYAEGFEVIRNADIAPGSVLVIDPLHPGKLALSTEPYDTRVAGVVAGGKGLGSGVRLGGDEFPHDVALAGRVYCYVDATETGVEPGDLLTTSYVPGFAMKAIDRERAQGAILGKAMERLEKGTSGQILVLVSLQ